MGLVPTHALCCEDFLEREFESAGASEHVIGLTVRQ